MKRIFKLETPPVFLAILLSTIAWINIHITERVTSIPMVEYGVSSDPFKDGYQFTYTISNITSDKLLEHLSFFVTAEQGDSILFGDVHYYPPIEINGKDDRFQSNRAFLKCDLSQLQPGSHIDLTIHKKTQHPFPLRIRSSSPVFLSEPSLKTFFIKRELQIFISIAIAALLLCIFYVFHLKSEEI